MMFHGHSIDPVSVNYCLNKKAWIISITFVERVLKGNDDLQKNRWSLLTLQLTPPQKKQPIASWVLQEGSFTAAEGGSTWPHLCIQFAGMESISQYTRYNINTHPMTTWEISHTLQTECSLPPLSHQELTYHRLAENNRRNI